MINEVTRAAFADELQKIASVRTHIGNALRAGWHGFDAKGVPVEGAGWALGNKGWRSKIPLGGKSMAIASTAAQLPGVFGKEDPSGREHSRLERTIGLTGNTIGGMAATGKLMGTAFGAKHPIISSLVGGIGGGIAGERLLTTPWAAKRRMFHRHPVAPQAAPDDAGWRNTAPGGLNTTPNAVTGQAQAM